MVIKGVIDVYAGAADVCMIINVDEMDKGINVVNVNKNVAGLGSGTVAVDVDHEGLDLNHVHDELGLPNQEPFSAAIDNTVLIHLADSEVLVEIMKLVLEEPRIAGVNGNDNKVLLIVSLLLLRNPNFNIDPAISNLVQLNMAKHAIVFLLHIREAGIDVDMARLLHIRASMYKLF